MTIKTLIVAGMMPIKRERRLPFHGRILVELGEEVHPEDIIAEASIPSQVQVLDIAKALGLDPSEVDSYLVRDVNEPLEQGDVIAQYDGMMTRLVRMPMDGHLVAVDQGCAYISTDVVKTQLRAGMIGKIEAIMPGFGVVISTVGSLLQGMWGNGLVGSGLLQVLPAHPDAIQEDASDDPSIKEHIIAVDGCCQREHLDEYAQEGVSGLILGSLNPELVSVVEDLPFPVIVLQGFGELPIDSIRFQLLESRSGSIACINACVGTRFSEMLPEVVIPQPKDEYEKQPDLQKLALGQLVQLNSGQHRGKSGIVKELPEASVIFESGLEVPSATVHLVSDDQIINIPRRNLLIIG